MYSKYHNKKCEYKGLEFDSIREKNYYVELELLKKAGIVDHIETQVKYILQEGFTYQGKRERAITYYADFRVTYTDEHIEIVDVKGCKTKEYLLKRKLLLKKLVDTGDKAKFVEVH